MAKFLKFPDDPYDQLVWLLEFTGQLRTSEFSLRNRLMTLMGAVFTINGWLGPLLAAVSYEATMQERGEMVLYATSGFNICTKFFNLYFRQGDSRRSLRIMKSLWKKQNLYSMEIKEKCDKRCKSAMKSLFSILNSLVVLMIVKGVFMNVGKTREDWKLPFPCWFPLDQRYWFFTNCTWETLTLFMEMFNVSVSYYFHCFTVIQASAQMEVLSVMLQSSPVPVNSAIRLHIRIIRLVRYFNRIHTPQMTLEIFLYGLQVAAAGYTIMKLLRSGGELGSLAFSLYVLFLYISFSYLLCLGGHEITLQSEKVYSSIYQSEWYELSLQEQKNISIMLCSASRSLLIRYKGLVVFSMERYAQMIQATYSYLTILSGMEL